MLTRLRVRPACDILAQALLTALKTRVQDSDLPMDTSLLFNTHVQPCRKQGTPALDVKLSTYKKLSKFLQVGVCVCV